MSKLLHIQSSPRGGRSSSIAVADHFITAYCATHPDDTIETINVWEMNLPEFDGAGVEAKYTAMHSQSSTPEQAQAWQAVKSIADHFMSADKYLFSLPMWNFSVPYKLKHLIDVLVQPGITVNITKAGPQGAITGKPTVAIYSRAFALGPGSGQEKSDFQVPYLHQILGFIGMTDVQDILIEPTEGGPTAKDEAVAAGKLKAAQLAPTFWSNKHEGARGALENIMTSKNTAATLAAPPLSASTPRSLEEIGDKISHIAGFVLL